MAPDSKSFQTGTELSHCHYSEIYDVKFPKDCSDLFVTASVQDIRVWLMKDHQEVLRIKVPNVSCYAIDITYQGSSIVSACSNRTMALS